MVLKDEEQQRASGRRMVLIAQVRLLADPPRKEKSEAASRPHSLVGVLDV